MYKNFNLTDEERKEILESHSSYGYKKPINEQSAPVNTTQATTAQPAATAKPAPQGTAPQFNTTIKGDYAIDCKTKLVMLGGNNLKLTKEANIALVSLFCSPKYRAPITTTNTPVNPAK
jgi:hypothetical protein